MMDEASQRHKTVQEEFSQDMDVMQQFESMPLSMDGIGRERGMSA